MRLFTPPGLHLLVQGSPMVCPCSINLLKNGYIVKYMPKKAKQAVNLHSEDRKKLKMSFVSPQTVKYNPIQLHLPNGPFLFPKEKMAEEHLFLL